ncbi:MAG: hypothetical protein ACT4O2_08610, partial [Beijerinckiaceae bacterium]
GRAATLRAGSEHITSLAGSGAQFAATARPGGLSPAEPSPSARPTLAAAGALGAHILYVEQNHYGNMTGPFSLREKV